MSRFQSGSYGHKIHRIGRDQFRLHWTVDHYYASSRLRHPRVASRDTDKDGAERFAKRWKISMPAQEQDK